MSGPTSRFGVALVGNRRYPRYAIVDNHCRMGPVRYWTGDPMEPWSPEPGKAMWWADPQVAAVALGELGLLGSG
jgi:hypothetical protein